MKKKESKENGFFEYIENELKGINYDLFRKYFNFETPIQLTKNLFEIKNENKNNDFVEELKNIWSKLNDEIEEMSNDEKKIEKLHKILKIVEKFLNVINETKKDKD